MWIKILLKDFSRNKNESAHGHGIIFFQINILFVYAGIVIVLEHRMT